MKGETEKGKCTMGRFYGVKLHLVIIDKGEIIQLGSLLEMLITVNS
jgi:hypothetical protein